jgi:hypothetical protein
MSLRIDNPILKDEYLYLIEFPEKDKDGKAIFEIAQYRKEKFWFFGWEVPEVPEKFLSWKELIVAIKE